MANWCSTEITFFATGENSSVIDKMFDDFSAIIPSVKEKEKYEVVSMRDFAEHYFPNNADAIDARGMVNVYFEHPYCTEDGKYKYFSISTQTAWSAKMGLWYKIATQFYPGVQIAYAAEEGGNDYFLVYDDSRGKRFYPYSFYVYGYLPYEDGDIKSLNELYDPIQDFQGTLDDLQNCLDDILPFKYEHQDTVEELDKELNTKLLDYTEALGFDDDAYIFVSDFVEYPPSEFDLWDFQLNKKRES